MTMFDSNLESNEDQMNLHIPVGASLGLRAFNLTVGAAFMLIDEPDPRVWIVERVSRDVNFEQVSIWAHDGTNNYDLSNEKAFNLDFNYTVALVGIVVNFNDLDDNDWGTN